MRFMKIILKTLALPLFIPVVLIAGVIGASVYWYYWTFKEEELYKTQSNEERSFRDN